MTDQPFHRHSGPAGEQSNLSPMLGDLNRYYNEGVRNVAGAHMFTSDPIERFIVEHQVYETGSPARRDLEFKPVAQSPPETVTVKKPVSMKGSGHELTTTFKKGSVTTTLASRDAKSILTIVDNEVAARQALSASSSEPDKTKHATVATDLGALRPRYDTQVNGIRAMADKTKIRDEVLKLNDEVAKWVIDVANRHGLHDFLRKALQLDPITDRIQTQIKDQLEKQSGHAEAGEPR